VGRPDSLTVKDSPRAGLLTRIRVAFLKSIADPFGSAEKRFAGWKGTVYNFKPDTMIFVGLPSRCDLGGEPAGGWVGGGGGGGGGGREGAQVSVYDPNGYEIGPKSRNSERRDL